MRGYFAIGCEGISKPGNIGALLRTAHAFGAAYVFTIGAVADTRPFRGTDTSSADGALPFYDYPDIASMQRPKGCALVGIELMDDAIDLPSFRHPKQAAYVLGSERGGLSPEVAAACDHIVKIPTRFSLNLSLAGGIVMYDRVKSFGRFAPRPVQAGEPTETVPEHVHGNPVLRGGQR